MQNLKDLYKISKDTPNASDKPTYIPAGIHENIRLIEVKYDISPNNNEFLAFTFQNENGDTLTNTEWPTKFKVPFEQMSEIDQAKKVKWIRNQMSKIRQIVEAVVGKLEEEIEGGSFAEVAKNVIKVLGDSYKDKLVRIKAVYDDKGFVTLPNWAEKTFIENVVDVPKESTKIRQLPSDRFERPSLKSDNELNEINPLLLDDKNIGDDNTTESPF